MTSTNAPAPGDDRYDALFAVARTAPAGSIYGRQQIRGGRARTVTRADNRVDEPSRLYKARRADVLVPKGRQGCTHLLAVTGCMLEQAGLSDGQASPLAEGIGKRTNSPWLSTMRYSLAQGYFADRTSRTFSAVAFDARTPRVTDSSSAG